MIPTPLEHRRAAILLAQVPPGNALDFQPGGTGQGHGLVPHGVPQRFGEPPQIQAAKVGRRSRPCQRGGMTDIPQTAGDDDAIKTTQRAGNLRGVTGKQ